MPIDPRMVKWEDAPNPDAVQWDDEKPSANNSDFARLITGKPKAPTVVDRLKRTASLGGRSILHGVYDLTTLAGGDLLNYAEQKVRGVPMRSQRENADYLADRLGLARPESTEERISDDVSSALVGGGGFLGTGRALAMRTPGVAQSFGEMLASQPATQIAGNTIGSGAASTTREMGGSPGAQVVAGLLGGIAPGVAVSSSAQGLRGIARGFDDAGRQQVERNLADFRAAGTTPTVGQATGNRAIRAAEVALSRLPGGAGVIARKAQQQGEEIGAGVRGLSDDLAPGADPTTAGRAIKRGIVGPKGFAERTGDVSERLYGNLDNAINPGTTVGVQNTVNALHALNPEIPGAPSLTPLFQNGRIGHIKDAFLSDSAPAAGGLPGITSPRLPYQGLKQTRTLVGKELQNANFASDTPVGDWKQLYGGLTEDMRGAA
jgi:hypothetical protein